MRQSSVSTGALASVPEVSVLFTSAGRRVELINCFRADAARLGVRLRALAADLRPDSSAACQLADASFGVAPCRSPEYIGQLLEICGRERVACLVPTIDTELQVLADHRARFESLGTRVAISSSEVVRLARDKEATASFLAENGIPTPRTVRAVDFAGQADTWKWPVVLKPIGGSSSVGMRILRDPREFGPAERALEGYIVQEHLGGDEYTVNVYCDDAGRFRAAVPHRREEVRGGEVSKGVTRRIPSLEAMAERMANALVGARGAWCFQGMVGEAGEVGVFEINARFGGGYPLAHAAGARFSQWLLEEALGLPTSANNQWTANLRMLRYDAAVFREMGVDA